MNNRFEELKKNVLNWAEEKGIFEKGTPIAQAGKTLEEATEILVGIAKDDKEEIIDSLGDTLVTIIIQLKCKELIFWIVLRLLIMLLQKERVS